MSFFTTSKKSLQKLAGALGIFPVKGTKDVIGRDLEFTIQTIQTCLCVCACRCVWQQSNYYLFIKIVSLTQNIYIQMSIYTCIGITTQHVKFVCMCTWEKLKSV